MNPKSFPKRLDSKTSCLRITVPENLDLALEGLIRKVLREQPQADDIYAFAANYFETLLSIRDKAGIEYTAPQLCPFHNDEETREMIVLAGTFPKQVPARVQGKGSVPLKTETVKETDRTEHEKGLKASKKTLKDAKLEVETKQATPDLIKKLPLLAQNQGLNGEEVSGDKTTDLGPDHERTEPVTGGADEEEYSTSDPIKEFVEKELLREGNSKENEARGSTPPVSNAGEKKGADGGDNPGAADNVGGVISAGEDEGKQKIDPGMRETDEKGVEAADAARKIGSAAHPDAERPLQETQQKKEKENEESEEETGKGPGEEESDNQRESAAEMEMEVEGVEATLPPLPTSLGGAERPAEELVHEVTASPSYTEADVSQELEGGEVMQRQSAASSEAGLPKEKGVAEVGGVQEDKNEIDAQPSTASPMKTDEASPETSSLVTNSYDSKHVENGARAAETDKSQKSDKKEATDNAVESIARSEEAQDLSTEASSGRTERCVKGSETGSSPERGKDVQEVEEGGASFEEQSLHQTKGGETSKGRKSLDIETEDPSTSDVKSTEGAKLASASAVEAERASEETQTGTEDSTVEPDHEGAESSGKLDPGLKAGGSEILNPEQFSISHMTDSDKEPEPIHGDEVGKERGDKKLSDEEDKAKNQSLAERRESPSNQTSPEEEFTLQKAQDVQCGTEAPTEESAGIDGRRTSSTTEEPKSEEQRDTKQETPRDASSPREPGETPEITARETESAGSQEFKTEATLTTENETASVTDEELCTVVDVNHLKRDGGNQEEPEPRPENTAEERSAPESEGSPPSLSPSVPNGETSRENRYDGPSLQQEPEPEDTTQGKTESEEPPNATAVQEPVKSEADKEKVDPSEGTPPETREGFDPSARGKQIIIVEEPETTNENAEESSPPGEIQIKTIQTHYYDALRVPETVTREYRVHEVIVPPIDGLLGAATPPPPIPDEMQESPGDEEGSGRLTDDNAVPPAPKTSPASDGNVSPYAEAAEAQSHVIAGSLLTVDGLDRDARESDSDDLPHPPTPTSDVVSNLEFSFQAASETFLTNEKRFSSLEKEEIRFVTLPKEEVGKGEPEERVVESGRGIEDPAGARPAPLTPEKTEAAGESTEEAEVVIKDGKRPVGSSGGSPASGGGRAADGDDSPTESASEKPVSEPRCQGEDESAPDASRLPSGIKSELAEDFRLQTAAGVESAKESFNLKTQETNALESCSEEGRVLEGRSTERTPTGEASYTETDSTTSSAKTEVKRADSARRDFASVRSLSSARSLDSGKRNPLLRTRSLSTHRHGVADFEVWTTIEKELEEAATKIQSKFRGYKARKKLRREVAVQISTEESSKRSTPVEADDADNAPRATGEFHDGIVLAEHPR